MISLLRCLPSLRWGIRGKVGFFASVALLFAAAALQGFGQRAPDSKQPPLFARFANPPAEARILKIIHPWPDNSEQQDQLIRSLSA
jgi:hypothetical protein